MPTVNEPVRPWMKNTPNKPTYPWMKNAGSRQSYSKMKSGLAGETPAEKEARLAPTRFYRTKGWGRIRAAQLLETPYCEKCYEKKLLVEATVVDHKVPIRQGGSKTDSDNLQSMCASCHNRKSQTERSGSHTKHGSNGR